MESISDGPQDPPETITQLMARLDRIGGSLPKRLRQCAEYLRANINLIAVSTVAEISAAAGVAPSAFMRFCQALGFSGYSEMQALFRAEYAQSRPDYPERLSDLRARGGHGGARLLADFIEAGHKSLISLSNNDGVEQLTAAIEQIARARVVHLVGVRRSYPVVSYMGYMLQKMEIPCIVHTGIAGVEYTASIQSGDVLFAVTFAPFAQETRGIAEAAHVKGVPVILLTDSADCPLAKLAAAQLIAREVDSGAFRVPIASMTLATTIAVGAGSLLGTGA
ncbi:transcriptional regulator, RpiR family [Celeribacter baekdonensis]|uniref:Transcriptional regulator, RpiR family n=1 Tax=Celeribacter baekdonensis TaxID=875171 RepID=A0A1G7QYI5_9RHOB|nr:MurR/RpiR family transcriptional regulator [Celeribacter baekdonensis]SDG02730.1 transcriptional regulator, RpiR family [Celeribacter baekdonensis]